MRSSICFLLVISLFLSCKEGKKEAVRQENSPETPQLFYNGDILTMASDQVEYAEAVVEENGKIVFVGSQKDAESKYESVKKIDLNGKTLLPGFIDPHSHFGMVSNTMGQVDLNPEPVGTVINIDDILKKLETFKEERNIPDGEWIFGWGYDDGELAEKRHPTNRDMQNFK
ncbi:amidohydrolase family protein [Gelidibacter sp.]|uniref:amidohydrolase family protein n=1 Tax=Gelidibacter sp. TaxID=2018083 RepID=UPI002B69DD62|nr:amidohydrolase family protein [Gelidibacter sp.]HUH28913.1 amidohydrolase family protein [Gelidibacter sp.]